MSDEITPEDVAAEPMLRFFGWAHLPPELQEKSAPYGRLALHVARTTPRNPERTVALRKLLEAKDAGVRAHLPPPAAQSFDFRGSRATIEPSSEASSSEASK